MVMTYNYSSTRSRFGHSATSPSPLRHASTASSGSSDYSNSSNPSCSSSSDYSSSYQHNGGGHKRGVSEAAGLARSPRPSNAYYDHQEASPPSTYANMRQSLRPLPQAPGSASPPSHHSHHARSHSTDTTTKMVRFEGSASPPPAVRPHSLALSRSDSIRAPVHDRARREDRQLATFERPALEEFQKSSTGHLRTLSKFAEEGSEDFSIRSPDQEVAGMHGRRRLQRTTASHKSKSALGSGWMDRQRQFLQAYEYLCHIGEAKEWIEDIISKPIPPIVQLEEHLRDGVTLAEIVQALYPARRFRIFHHPRLQYRHTDNMAIFFRFLAEVELPELFRFELVDLYEKKNIPKVIYCIHALSWLLYRKGIVDFRIGNLVGQLQFEDHELEAMQMGLDKAGVSLPSFAGMGANFGVEPEPVESEEDRIDRELGENEGSIVDLQAQIRGATMRLRLGDMMQQLWDSEDWLIDLQSRIRGEWARQIFQYRVDMKRFATNLQSAIRGFLVRNRQQSRESYWRDREEQVVMLQSLLRAKAARGDVQHIKSRLQRNAHGIRQLQAAIRGALARRDVEYQYEQTRAAETTVQRLQAAIRGALVRKMVDSQISEAQSASDEIELLQAHVRGMLQREAYRMDLYSLRQHESMIAVLQSNIRGYQARKRDAALRKKLAVRVYLRHLRQQLQEQELPVIFLQSCLRGARLRGSMLDTLQALGDHERFVLGLQSRMRGFFARRRHLSDMIDLQANTPSIVELQSACRGFLERQRTYDLLYELNQHNDSTVALQSMARACLLRFHVTSLLSELDAEEYSIVELQALARGMMVRRKFAEKKKYFQENMERVIKVQSFIRGRQQGKAYKSLTSGKNPPVGTIKNFVHLLNDNDFDFEEEIEFERLRKTVVQHVRQNEMAEQYVDQIDTKIALLVKNKITLDEVVKHQRHYGGHVGSMLANKDISSKDPFDLKALNKASRRKLEHYQELFFLLQTQPQYLARLFRRIREQATAEKDCKRIEQLMMVLFGFAQKRREEYYLLKLVAKSIREEAEACHSLQEYLRGNFFWSKLFGSYVRTPRDRKFLKDLLGPLVRETLENAALDLESDPIQIYRSLINNEELRTGQRSRRPLDVSREEAIKDPETRETFIHHLQDLRDLADQFFTLFEDLLYKMPFGVRFVAQKTFETLRERFPQEQQPHLLQIVAHWLWKAYLAPALTDPHMWGVVDRGLAPIHKRNLGEVAKVLGQIAAGRLFDKENVYLQPLNNYISESFQRLDEIMISMIDIRDAETQFDIDEFHDLYSRTKPTIYIKLTDIFAIHNLVVTDIACICPSQDDTLREVIRELGSAKNNENELIHVSSTEISLTLNPKLHEKEDPDAAIKALFTETKRCVLYMIRVQTGPDLLSIMVQPITAMDEERWAALIDEELRSHNQPRRRSAYADTASIAPSTVASASSHLDILSLSYTELKTTCLENILRLEQAGRVSRHTRYQELLNAIAVDIRTKHRRRIQRTREIEEARKTLANLDEKCRWLEDQLKSYNDYIEQAMVTLQNKKGKKKFLLPFTKQYNHEKELQRTGRVPKFGSYKYSARTLADKGVLVAWAGYGPEHYNRLDITISSNRVGIFLIEGSQGSMMIPGASAEVPLDELLQAQFDNHTFMNLFQTGLNAGTKGEGQGALRLNVNLFLHLVFKKFYKDA